MGRKKKCYSGIGGQAVLEGIMMKNNTRYSVAVRKPNGEIDVEIGEYAGILGDSKIAKTPFIRGIFSFIDSMRLGTRCLNHSASFYEEAEEPERETAADKVFNKVFKDKAESVLMTITTIIAVVFAVGLFMVLPYFISSYLKGFVRNDSLLTIIEGLIRILIFVLYVLLISLMKDIRRVYMYHGAEHKCINCIERGRELTVANVMKSSKRHRRCGTSFLLFVMLVSVVLFFFIRVDNMALKALTRILLIPVIAGISYEIIRLAGRSDNWLVRMISAPGLWLQGLTTKEPDEDMVEVAIKAVEAVFDWRGYLRENFGYEGEAAEEKESIAGTDAKRAGVEEVAAEGVSAGKKSGEKVAAEEESTEKKSREKTAAKEESTGKKSRKKTAAGEESAEKKSREKTAVGEESVEKKNREKTAVREESAEKKDIEGTAAKEEKSAKKRTTEDKRVKKTAVKEMEEEKNRQKRKPAIAIEDLAVEDEDEPSFIGNDRIE